MIGFIFFIERLILYNFICSYVVTGCGKNELDHKAIQTMVTGKDVDDRLLIIQILLTVNLLHRFRGLNRISSNIGK